MLTNYTLASRAEFLSALPNICSMILQPHIENFMRASVSRCHALLSRLLELRPPCGKIRFAAGMTYLPFSQPSEYGRHFRALSTDKKASLFRGQKAAGRDIWYFIASSLDGAFSPFLGASQHMPLDFTFTPLSRNYFLSRHQCLMPHCFLKAHRCRACWHLLPPPLPMIVSRANIYLRRYYRLMARLSSCASLRRHLLFFFSYW